MTQSDKPRQLEPGEFLARELRQHWPNVQPRERYARAEAACIAKGREEAEATVEYLESNMRAQNSIVDDLLDALAYLTTYEQRIADALRAEHTRGQIEALESARNIAVAESNSMRGNDADVVWRTCLALNARIAELRKGAP